nr:hypothetical protein BaRGS_026334 [Batillaria attramentaria]
MCSIKVTLEHADGKHETFSRPSESGAGDGAKGDLHQLRTWMVDAADEEVDDDDDDDDDDDGEDDDEANGDVEPAVKKKKTV